MVGQHAQSGHELVGILTDPKTWAELFRLSDHLRGLSSVHAVNGTPIDDIAPVLSPSVMPMVSQESKAASGIICMSCGLTPPTSTPNGESTYGHQ